MTTAGFDPDTLPNRSREQFETSLTGLTPAQRASLLEGLSRVAAPIVRDWLRQELLQDWVEQGRRVAETLGARGLRLSSTMFAATPDLLPLLSRLEMLEWVRFLVDIESIDGESDFGRFPDGLTGLNRTERMAVYRLGRSAVYRSRAAAAGIYHTLPRSLAGVAPALRSVLLRCLQPVASFDPDPLPAVIPFLGPTLNTLASDTRLSVLERIAGLAPIFPTGIARLFRTLSRAYEDVGADGVLTWIHAGEQIAQRNPQAGEAFFTLASRTSLQVLQHESPAVLLSEVHSALVKFIHMLCGDAVSIQELDHLSFPPPLAVGDEEDEFLPLPASIDEFPTFEENFRLLCTLAAHQAGRIEFGTYALSIAEAWPRLPVTVRARAPSDTVPPDLDTFYTLFPRPDQIEALFLFVEGRRISARLAAAYPGLRPDLDRVAACANLLPPFIRTISGFLDAALTPGWEPDASVEDSLVLACELSEAVPTSTGQAGQADMGVQADPPAQQVDAALTPQEEDIAARLVGVLRAGRAKKKVKNLRPTSLHGIPLDAYEDDEEDQVEQKKRKREQLRRRHTTVGVRYVYDEWDFLIEDYRARWCELFETRLEGDEGGFFESTLTRYAAVIPHIKREFQQLRPRMYRLVKGLEDGEVIDLDAAVGARVDVRTGVTPTPRLYAARQPLERDVAALFLLDLSASTDERVHKNGPAESAGNGSLGDAGHRQDASELRVIDVLKEAVVVLSAALDEIGDAYAIYGFSSAGRHNVEVYPVKSFTEKLSDAVKGRISGLAPKRSTRMGAAVRHATRKLKDVASRAKLLVLLSDGYPEDADYGRAENTPLYGLRDTMMALREAEHEHIMSFCLTVDKSGHDYLREMCPPSRCMVLEDIPSLPLELPKIYRRHVQAHLSESF